MSENRNDFTGWASAWAAGHTHIRMSGYELAQGLCSVVNTEEWNGEGSWVQTSHAFFGLLVKTEGINDDDSV